MKQHKTDIRQNKTINTNSVGQQTKHEKTTANYDKQRKTNKNHEKHIKIKKNIIAYVVDYLCFYVFLIREGRKTRGIRGARGIPR